MNLLKKKIFEESPVLENRYKTEAKSVDLINLLEISKWKRTYEDLKNIGLHISIYPCFQELKNTNEIIEISKEISLKFFPVGLEIYRKFDIADGFYIILDGRSNEYLLESESSRKILGYQKQSIFKEYNIGDCFGRFDINLEDPRRDTTAVAEENCYLLVVEKETIKKYLKTTKTLNYQRIFEFYRQLSIFSKEPDSVLEKLAHQSNIKLLQSKTVVVQQNETPKFVYCVLKGKLKVLKNLNMEKAEPFLLEIDELEKGDYFCLNEYLAEEKMEFSIITEINTELISVLGIDIKEKIENDNKIFIQNKEYPNDQEIKEMYKELKDWQSFKKKSIDNVLINKKNKNGVSLNRSPISIPHIVKSPENIKDINSHPGLAYCKMKFLI